MYCHKGSTSLKFSLSPSLKRRENGNFGVISQQVTLSSTSGSSNISGLKRRFASRHFQDAECFRIPENLKIFVSVAIENHFLQNESQNSETSLRNPWILFTKNTCYVFQVIRQ
jgi:hypothetical protein